MEAATAILEEKKQLTETEPTLSFVNQIAALGRGIIVEDLSREDFYFLVAKYPELRMEQETNGNVTIMAPIAGFGGSREGDLYFGLKLWSKKSKTGYCFGPNTGFILPDESTKSPDCSWISQGKFEQLKQSDDKGFPKIVPDFVIELVSKTDRVPLVKKKMTQTWIANGVQLAWMINPYQENAFIYRADGTIEKVEGFDKKLSGEDILEGFELELDEFRLINGK